MLYGPISVLADVVVLSLVHCRAYRHHSAQRIGRVYLKPLVADSQGGFFRGSLFLPLLRIVRVGIISTHPARLGEFVPYPQGGKTDCAAPEQVRDIPLFLWGEDPICYLLRLASHFTGRFR